MKKSIIKSALFATILLVSAFCFIYVNNVGTIATAARVSDINVEQPNVKNTKMPDIKLVKTVLDVIGKFITAK